MPPQETKPKPIRIPSEEERRAGHVLHRLNQMKIAKSRYAIKWPEYERIYKMFEESRSGEDAWRANLPDTWSYATIKTAQSAFVDSKVTPLIRRHEDEDKVKAKDLKDLYDDIAEKGDLETELYYARLDAFKLGTGFLKTVYIEDKRTIHEIQKFNADTGEITYKKKEIKDFDDPKTVRISPHLMFVDEMARSDFWNTARDCAEAEILSFEDAKAKYGHLVKDWDSRVQLGGRKEALPDINDTGIAYTSAAENTGPSDEFRQYQFFAPVEINGANLVEILHYWNKIEDTYEILANGAPIKVRTKNDPSPIPYISKCLPYVPIVYSPYSGDEFWGAGIIEIGYAETKNIRQDREMQNDRQKLSLFSPAFSDHNDEIDQRVLKLKPFSIIRTKGGAPKQFTIPGIGNGDIALQEKNEESYKRATGIDERVLGVSNDQIRLTATEVTFLRDAALKRLREFMFLYKKALAREVRLKIQLFKQYYSNPIKREQRVKADKGVKAIVNMAKKFKVDMGNNIYQRKDVRDSIFEGDIDIDVDMDSLIPTTQAQMVALWAQVIRDVTPFIAAGVVNLSAEKIVNNYLEALEVDPERLKNDEETAPIIAAEGEHKLFANKQTAPGIQKQLSNGTPPAFLSAEHIKKHQELLDNDDEIESLEIAALADHIALDIKNFGIKMAQEQMQQQANLQAVAGNPNLAQTGGIPLNPPRPPLNDIKPTTANSEIFMGGR